VIALRLLGCNRYTFLVVEGDDIGTVSDDVDVLFVLDASESMVAQSASLGAHLTRFVRDLPGEGGTPAGDGLSGVVAEYVARVAEPGRLSDFQFGVTTTDAAALRGGLLGDPAVLARGDEGLADALIGNLLCDAACFPQESSLPSESGSACGDPTIEGLDCLCGSGEWIGHCGANREEPLEAVLLAACRAVDEPPDVCFDLPELFTAADVGSNAGLLRPGATFMPVVITDEGDDSRREPMTEPLPRAYQDALRAFGIPVTWVVLGPMLDDAGQPECGGAVASWGVERFDALVSASGGLKASVHSAGCGPADLRPALESLGAVIGGARGAVPLIGDPQPDSIRVAVEARTIAPSEPAGRDPFGLQLWSDGFRWVEADHQVLLHGDAVPEAGDLVRVWYLPR
jgi:hypothetical protein